MSDIFLSYASQDRERILPLVEAIERYGYSVWWDRKIDVGTAFDKKIETEIEGARCIIVIWSNSSLNSDWVRAEANEGLQHSRLIPVLIDDVKPPLAFRTLQTPRLLGWPKVRSANGLNDVLLAINRVLNQSAPESGQSFDANQLLPEKSIAVLPFRSLSANPDDQYFAEGLSDEILNVISQIPDLSVASRTSAQQFQQTEGSDSRAIGAQLNVRYLLEGSVRRSGQKIRITVQIIQASDGYTLWSKTYNKTLDDVFAVQDEIAARVADALKSSLWETVLEHQSRNRTNIPAAHEAYLLAVHYNREMHQGGHEALDLVRKHAENAVELDPEFVPAWILLADVYLNRMGYRMPLSEAHPLARRALDNAIRLDPNNPEVLLQLAELTRGDHQYHEALQMYQRARSLDRVSPQVDYATLLFTMGDLDLALQEFEHCIEQDPENFSLWYYYAATYFGAGDLNSAIRHLEKSLTIAGTGFLSDGVRATLAGMIFLSGETSKAQEVLQPCLAPNTNRIDFEKGLIACVQAMLGDKESANVAATKLEAHLLEGHVDPQAFFWVYFGLNDTEKCFHWMEQIVAEDSFPTIYFFKTWPLLDPLRTDPRFGELLRRAGIQG